MSKSKQKGTSAETAVARYLFEHGWPFVERRALAGAHDLGDITGTPGICWEVKYAGGNIKMSEWMAETEVETANAGAAVGVLVVKPPGVGMTRVGKWLAVMSAKQNDELMIAGDLGYAVSEPITYTSEKVLERLASIKGRAPHYIVVVQAIPPRMKDFPMTWYRVMYLEDAVTLLHSAGYGDEDTTGVPLG